MMIGSKERARNKENDFIWVGVKLTEKKIKAGETKSDNVILCDLQLQKRAPIGR